MKRTLTRGGSHAGIRSGISAALPTAM